MKKERKNISLKKQEKKIVSEKETKKDIIEKNIVKKSFPIGIILIAIYLLIQVLSYFQRLFNPLQQLGPIILSSTSARLFLLVNIVLLIVLVIGLFKRKEWARCLGLIYLSIWIILEIINIISFLFNPYIFQPYIQNIIPQDISMDTVQLIINITMMSAIIIDLVILSLILLYLIKKKKNFTQ